MPDFELKTLLDDLGFTGDERAQAEALFTPRVDKAKKLFMSQADYSRGKDALAKQLRDIEAKERLADDQIAQAVEYEKSLGTALGLKDLSQVSTRATQLLQELETEKAKAAALDAELRKHATDYGFAYTAPTVTAPATTTPARSTTSDIDTSRFLTHEGFQRELEGYPLLPAALHDLGVQHQKLFGTPLENVSELVALSIQSTKEAAKYKDPSRARSVQQIWEEKHSVPQKRLEIAGQQKEAEFKTRLEEEKIKWASQHQSSGVPNSGIPGSPILAHQFKPTAPEGKVATVNVGNERRGVDAAMSKFGNYYGGQAQ